MLPGGFIGADFSVERDLTHELPEEWREFNRKYIPVYLAARPDKSRIGAGLACGALWTVAKGILKGDVVLSPDGEGSYRVGEIVGGYSYAPGEVLPHRRSVHWLTQSIERRAMSEALQRSTGSIGTVSNVSGHREEIEELLQGIPTIAVSDPTIEDPAAFAFEKHLEDFLVENWAQTDLGKEYDIFAEDGEMKGQTSLLFGRTGRNCS